MKKYIPVLALLLALCLVMPVLSFAEDTQDAEGSFDFSVGTPDFSQVDPVVAGENSIDFTAVDPVVFSVDGEEYCWSQVEEETEYLVNQGYLVDYDYRQAIEYMIQNHVIDKMIQTWNLDEFTAEEEEAFLSEAQALWDNAVASYIPYFLTEDTEEGREQARIITEYQLMASGLNVDVVVSDLKTAAVQEKLIDKILEGKDVTVTEEEIRKTFEEVAAQDQAMYEGNVGTYEMYTSYYGQESWYIPEGFRGVTHILLTVDEELLNQYFNLQVALEEGEDAEAAVTQADVDAALQAIMDSRKEDLDAISNWLANGESFENLIALYGTDPGMQDAGNLANGYAVHRDSVMWDSAFTAAAFSEKMQKPGDVSDPVVGSYGIHIVYYLRDIPGGVIEMTDEISQQIESYLSSSKINPLVNEALAQWQQECDVVYYDETINAAIQEAQTAE